MASIADTLTRKMRVPPTVQPPVKPQFDYEPLAGQLYPGAQDQTDTQLLAPPYQPPERQAADQAHMQRFDEVADRVKTLPQRTLAGAVEGARGSLENMSQIGAEVFNQRPMSSPQEMADRSHKAVSDLMGWGLGSTGKQALKQAPDAVYAVTGKRAANFNPNKLLKSLNLEYKGAGQRDIEDATGLFRGPDNLWRKEISDQGIKINTPGVGVTEDALFKEVVPDHPELYDAWKNLRDMKVEFRPMGQGLNARSGYYQMQGQHTPEHIGINTSLPEATQRATFRHEGFSHPVQAREGFSGGDPGVFVASNPIHQRLLKDEIEDALREGYSASEVEKSLPSLMRWVSDIAYKHSYGEHEANTIMRRAEKTPLETSVTRFYEEKGPPEDLRLVEYGRPPVKIRPPGTSPSDELQRLLGTLTLPRKP